MVTENDVKVTLELHDRVEEALYDLTYCDSREYVECYDLGEGSEIIGVTIYRHNCQCCSAEFERYAEVKLQDVADYLNKETE